MTTSLGVRVRWFNWAVYIFVTALLFLLVVCSPVSATTPETICTAAGYSSSSYYISDGLLSSNNCTVDAQCTSTSDFPSWGYGNYTIYTRVSAANCEGGCGSNPCFYYTTNYDYEAPTPTPTPTPTPYISHCAAFVGSSSVSVRPWYEVFYLQDFETTWTSPSGRVYRTYSLIFDEPGIWRFGGPAGTYGETTSYLICSQSDSGNVTIAPTVTPTTLVPTVTASPISPIPTFIVVPTYPLTYGPTSVPTVSAVPTSIVLPTLNITPMPIPSYLNETVLLGVVCNATVTGPVFCGIDSWIRAFFLTINSYLMYAMSFVISPFSTVLSSLLSLETDITAVFSGWSSLASIFVGLIWYFFMSVPPKVWNVITVGLMIDLIERVLDWPETLITR